MSLSSIKKSLKRLEEVARKRSDYFVMITGVCGSHFAVQYKRNGSKERMASRRFETVEETEDFLNSLNLSENSDIVNLTWGEWDDESSN